MITMDANRQARVMNRWLLPLCSVMGTSSWMKVRMYNESVTSKVDAVTRLGEVRRGRKKMSGILNDLNTARSRR
jgi:hypothetical protein